MTDPAMTDLAFREQQGITLVEMVATIVILAVALTGVTVALSGGIGRSADTLIEARAVALAQSYLDEIIGKRFDEHSHPRGIPPCWADCTDAQNLGPDTGETGRADFDDVDDYHGLDEGWQQDEPLRDAEGNIRQDYESFRVRVTVRYIDPAGAEASLGINGTHLADARDAKLVTVNISYPGNVDGWDFSVYKANF